MFNILLIPLCSSSLLHSPIPAFIHHPTIYPSALLRNMISFRRSFVVVVFVVVEKYNIFMKSEWNGKICLFLHFIHSIRHIFFLYIVLSKFNHVRFPIKNKNVLPIFSKALFILCFWMRTFSVAYIFFSTIFFYIFSQKKISKTLNKMNISEWHEIVSNNVKKYVFLQERDPTKELSICRIIVNEKTLPFGRGSQELDDEETISGLLINWADWNTFVSNFYIIFIYFRKHQFTYKQ